MADFNLEAYLEAVRQRDVERMLGFMADNVEFEDAAFPAPLRGKEVLRRMAKMLLPAVGELTLQPKSVVKSGNGFAALMQVSATYAKNITLPNGRTWPVAGKHVDIPVAVFATLDSSGRISHVTRVRDRWLAMRQMGITPEMMRSVESDLETWLKP